MIKVKLEKKEIEITKMPLGRYAQFIEIFHSLPQKLNLTKLSSASGEEIFKLLPDLILENIPEAQKIIEVGTGLSEQEVKNLGLNESIDLIMAIFEVNQYKEVYEKIKKGLARLPKAKAKATQEQPGLPTQSTP